MEAMSTETVKPPKGLPLYKNDKVEVFIPRKPNIPIEEGLQVKVESSKPFRRNVPKDILLRSLYAIMAAKAIAEGSQTPDEAWSNTRVEEDNAVNAYGRNTLNPDSWRKPVDANDRNVPEINTLPNPYNELDLQRIFRSYMHRWEGAVENMTLFDNPVSDESIDTEAQGQNADQIVWQSKQHVAKIIKDKHLEGTHIVVDPKLAPGESLPRQWMTKSGKGEIPDPKYIKMVLESTAIALGIRDLLGGSRGEIHNSGNWAGGLKDVGEGGSLDASALKKNPKKEKRAHRPDVLDKEKQKRQYEFLFDVLGRREKGEYVSDEEIEKGVKEIGAEVDRELNFETFMHVHVYIPESGKVILPIMSKGEAEQRENQAEGSDKTRYRRIIEQWQAIPKTKQEQINDARERLGHNRLSDWVNRNCSGKLAI